MKGEFQKSRNITYYSFKEHRIKKATKHQLNPKYRSNSGNYLESVHHANFHKKGFIDIFL